MVTRRLSSQRSLSDWPPHCPLASHTPRSLQWPLTTFNIEGFQSEMKNLKDYIHKTFVFFFLLTLVKILIVRIHYLPFRLYSLEITKSTRTNPHWYKNSIRVKLQYWKINYNPVWKLYSQKVCAHMKKYKRSNSLFITHNEVIFHKFTVRFIYVVINHLLCMSRHIVWPLG